MSYAGAMGREKSDGSTRHAEPSGQKDGYHLISQTKVTFSAFC